MAHYNLEKLAADTRVLRRFARRNVWNAPHRTMGRDVEANRAVNVRRHLARLQGEIDEEMQRHRQFHSGRKVELDAERARVDQARAWAEEARRMRAGDPATMTQRGVELADEMVQLHERNYKRMASDDPVSFMRDRAERLRRDKASYMSPEQVSARRAAAREAEASYNSNTGALNVHGADYGGAGSAGRLYMALHEDNERRASEEIRRKLRFGADPAGRRKLLQNVNFATSRLSASSHATPSIPLRDLNIANTATGPEASELRRVVDWSRRTNRGEARLPAEIDQIAAEVPGARAVLQGAGMISGGVRPATPGYVTQATNRLQSEAPLSPTVRARLQQMVDRHAERIAPGPARLNRNELRMIDDEFHKLHNPDLPQLLLRRGPSQPAPATPLPTEQRDAFREALKGQPGLTRKQFLAR